MFKTAASRRRRLFFREVILQKYLEIRWHGRGGQGTVTGAKTLAYLVQSTGQYVTAFPEYGPERRGAPIRAFNRFSGRPIRVHTPVESPDVVIVADATLLNLDAVTDGICEETIFLVNTEHPPKRIGDRSDINPVRVFMVPADVISQAVFKRDIPNSAIIGAFAAIRSDVVSREVLFREAKPVYEKMLGIESAEKNMLALRRGFEEVVSI